MIIYVVVVLQNRYYDMMLSTKLAGLGHASFLFMSAATERVSYIYPNVNSAGAGLLLSQTFTPDHLNLSEAGYNMSVACLPNLNFSILQPNNDI